MPQSARLSIESAREQSTASTAARARFSGVVLVLFFFFNAPATTEIYTSLHTLSLHDALPISAGLHLDLARVAPRAVLEDEPAPRRSEEHMSELQSRNDSSYAVFCLKKKNKEKKKIYDCIESRNLRDL